ncbi:GINS complex, Psf3 component [Coniochaeta ligniaria NRRL 30616]|uniref:DNA replication complex GINS protein PSF3 n=1 Tax=Coniochaeta ligniaria NRRL 30616 TaxID=1408157 RepID=A0A1J7J8W6_9PEZI|nr:GINS complex, Psf3 component [Coniochaeta ligniaria NRRL 30616]
MSYYDIDEILTEAEKIPCTFQLDVPDLGYLDNNPSAPLKAGTDVSLPLWLAELLALPAQGTDDGRAFATIELPSPLSQEVFQALKADPRAVPLRDQSAHFYSLATRMLDLFDEKELTAVLRKTFAVRAGEIALHARKGVTGAGGGTAEDKASNLGVGGAGEEFLRGLDEWERRLFRKAHDGCKAGKEWMDGVKKH